MYRLNTFREVGIWLLNLIKCGEHVFASYTAGEPSNKSQEDDVTLPKSSNLELMICSFYFTPQTNFSGHSFRYHLSMYTRNT